jgi:hypothetical protein
VRLPITESGCAGGVVGLARAADHLQAHPERAGLVLALEFSSLTFQRWDRSAANIVSSAIFGDGAAAAVLVGERHPLAGRRTLARLVDAESQFFPGTTHLMGFRLRNQGLQIILDRQLTAFIDREVVAAVEAFLRPRNLERACISRWILHPGGRKIIEAMAERLGLKPGDLAATEAVLSTHGNMSSVTVLFVLHEILRNGGVREGPPGGLRPGLRAEFALLGSARWISAGARRSSSSTRASRSARRSAASPTCARQSLAGAPRPARDVRPCSGRSALGARRRMRIADFPHLIVRRGAGLAVGVDIKLLHLRQARDGRSARRRRRPSLPASFDIVTISRFLHHFDSMSWRRPARLFGLARRAGGERSGRRTSLPVRAGVFPLLFGLGQRSGRPAVDPRGFTAAGS